VGVAIDVRSGASIGDVPQAVAGLRGRVGKLDFIFLDSRDETLVARFSETRRRHPLSDIGLTIEEAIAQERELLATIGEIGHRLDTSDVHPNTLRAWVKDIINAVPSAGLTLLFQSFGFKHGIPVDADFVFDVRCLPNPYWDPKLRPFTGKDEPVVSFLQGAPEVDRMARDIHTFISDWLPEFIRDGRSYLTVGIGCTGGQHRSVYLAEWLAHQFSDQIKVLVRHRALK
jgi:RNase adapter protein RapZ